MLNKLPKPSYADCIQVILSSRVRSRTKRQYVGGARAFSFHRAASPTPVQNLQVIFLPGSFFTDSHWDRVKLLSVLAHRTIQNEHTLVTDRAEER